MSAFRARSALVAATATLAAATLALSATPAVAAPAKAARTPVFHAYNTGKAYKLTYSTRIEAGYLKIIATDTRGDGAGVQIASFAKGYSFTKYLADYRKINQNFSSTGFKAVLKKVHYWGGAGTETRSSAIETVKLPVGQYVIWDDEGDAPAHAHLFNVVGKTAKRATPKYSAVVSMVAGDRFGGSTVLPAKGTIRVENRAKNSPHFLLLVHVKNSTTRKQVADYLNSGAQGEPSFALPGGAETDALNQGVAQFLTYSTPKGEYVELCFFPDPDTGMPHALMGMFRIVTLK